MISEATAISNFSSREYAPDFFLIFKVICRSARSLRSRQRFQNIFFGSILSSFPKYMWLSISDAKRLFAAATAWMSPVKWRLISSIGITCAYPPPAAPPFIPIEGPRDGSRSAKTAFFPILFKACARPIEVVVFPSPAGVGVIAVTKISFPFGLFLIFSQSSGFSLALESPYNSKSRSVMPIFFAISRIGFILDF